MKRWHVILLCILWIVVVVGFIPFSLTSLTTRVEDAATKLLPGDTIRLEKLSIQLWRGVSIRNARYYTSKSKDPSIRLSVSEVRLSYQLIPLLWGKVRFYKISLVKPKIEMVSQPVLKAKQAPSKPPFILPLPLGKIPLNLPVDLEISTLLISNASCRILSLPATEINITGSDANFSASLDNELTLGGTIRVDSIRVPGPFLATGFKSQISILPGKMNISDCNFDFYKAICRADFTLDTTADTLVRTAFSMKGLDLAALLKETGFNKGKVSGLAGVEMRVAGKNLNVQEWQGRGKLNLTALDISDLPFQRTLSTLLFLPKLTHLKFDKVGTSLVLSYGKVSTPDLSGTGNLMNFTGSGWVGLDLFANEKVRISLAPDLCSHLPPMVSREILLPEPGGRCGVGGELHGPLSDLKIDLDQKSKARAAGAIIKRAGGLLQNFFKRR